MNIRKSGWDGRKVPADYRKGQHFKMIVTCLNGGLGNQMFQYSAARSLADQTGEPLELDIRDLNTFQGQETVHYFRLHHYPNRARIAGRLGLVARGFFVSRKIRSFLGNGGFLRGDYVLEKEFTHQPISAIPGRFTYLEGYWQSWKYFEWNRQRILQDFTLKAEASVKNAELLKKIKMENSVCVHVRLGDYLRSGVTSAAHGNLTISYYQTALRKMKTMGNRLTYYLFSDEPAEALRFFKRGMKIYVVDHNVGQPQEDLRLMSACKYFITANSSFSWWGAWLSPRTGKKVISPKQWFAGLRHDTRDLVPTDWKRI